MGFRVECVDAETGRAIAGYVTRAGSEAEVRAEAERLGVRITNLAPLDTPQIPDAGEASRATRWNGRPLRWRVEPAVLFGLGFEHPRWGTRLYTSLAVSIALVKWKAVLAFFVVSVAGLLAAIGLDPSGEIVFAMVVLAVLVLPFALCKRHALRRLRATHAPDGFPTLHTLSIEGDELVHDRGGFERRWPLGQICEVHDLPRFLLVTLRDGSEVAIPHRAFAGASQVKAFSSLLIKTTGARLHQAYRSSWVGPEPLIKTNPRLGWLLIIAAVGAGVAVMAWLSLDR